MINNIDLFLFVLSVVVWIRTIIEFVIKLTQPTAEAIKMSLYEKITLIVTISYIITYILI
jgi:hypothetical protein